VQSTYPELNVDFVTILRLPVGIELARSKQGIICVGKKVGRSESEGCFIVELPFCSDRIDSVANGLRKKGPPFETWRRKYLE
jgi:hypothetical protein